MEGFQSENRHRHEQYWHITPALWIVSNLSTNANTYTVATNPIDTQNREAFNRHE